MDTSRERTSMQVYASTLEKLDKLKLVPMESYENVVTRLIGFYESHKEEATA